MPRSGVVRRLSTDPHAVIARAPPVECVGDRDPIDTPPTPGADRLYFRQLLAGRDFATHDQVARQMVNFIYLVGDRETGEAVIVDPAYGIDELLASWPQTT